MNSRELRDRTQAYALRVLRLCRSMPRDMEHGVLGKQLLRCATSVGANYRAACIAKSKADFVSKIKICEEECDESEYWLGLLVKGELVKAELVADLRREAHELTTIFAASAKTARTPKQTVA